MHLNCIGCSGDVALRQMTVEWKPSDKDEKEVKSVL